jgi:WD40 repeat protein
MAMSLALVRKPQSIKLIAAFENGTVVVTSLNEGSEKWDLVYKIQPHTQPVLSLDVSNRLDLFITSGADAIIAKHPVPNDSDLDSGLNSSTNSGGGVGVLSSLVKSASPPSGTTSFPTDRASNDESHFKPGEEKHVQLVIEPIRVVNTKHSGQQSVRIRSDGRILATAGWDSKVRVYSVKTLKEVAVLKWHQVGCYTIAMSRIAESDKEEVDATSNTDLSTTLSSVERVTNTNKCGNLSVKQRRIHHAKTAHWIAVGAKDGKISLWDIY